jgi:capsule polysaccharide export protein KpsE/RkpR
VRDKNRDEARQMCEEYIGVLNRLIEQDGNSTARKEREFLERRLVLANADLTQSERDFSQFGSKNKAISIPDQTKATIEAAANLQGQLVAAEADLNGLRQIYSPENPRIRTAEGRVALVRSKLQEMDGTGSKSASVDSGELIGPSLQQLPSLGVTYADLYRKLKLQEAVLGTLSTEYELARVQEARDIPTVRVLDSPNAPERKIAPSRTLIFLGLTFFSTSAGCLWVFLSSRWQALAPLDGKKLLLRTILSTYQNDFLRIRSFLSIKTRMGIR